MSSHSYVLTLIGPDRPGLVDALAEAVTQHGGNWTESHLVHLAGQFAGLLHVEIPPDQATRFCDALAELEKDGLRILTAHAGNIPPVAAATASINILGQDRPGIVREISRALAAQGVNVEELETACTSAPMSGETLFQADIRVTIPESCDPDALRAGLERIAADLMVEIKFTKS